MYNEVENFIDRIYHKDENIKYDKISIVNERLSKFYFSVEQKLDEIGINWETALLEEKKLREAFFELLDKKGIEKKNISKICMDLAELLKNDRSDEAIFLYAAMLTEYGLLFTEQKYNDRKIALWLDQSKNIYLLENIIKKEIQNHKNIVKLKKNMESPKHRSPKTDKMQDNESEKIYQAVRKNPAFYQYRNNEILYENIIALVELVNLYEDLQPIKPYAYSTLLSKKKKCIATHSGYIPKAEHIFKANQYTIENDNGKNFNLYQSYAALYVEMRKLYQNEADLLLSDDCFLSFSGLGEWFYDNVEGDENIPEPLKRKINNIAEVIFLPFDFEEDITDFGNQNPKLGEAYFNLLSDEEQWTDFVSAVRSGKDITVFADRLYKAANAEILCRNKEKALKYAEFCLVEFMQELNKRILVDAADNFIVL